MKVVAPARCGHCGGPSVRDYCSQDCESHAGDGGETLISTPELSVRSGATYRQLDYWARTGYLVPAVEAHGSGTRRKWRESAVLRAAAMAAASDVSMACGGKGTLLNAIGQSEAPWVFDNGVVVVTITPSATGAPLRRVTPRTVTTIAHTFTPSPPAPKRHPNDHRPLCPGCDEPVSAVAGETNADALHRHVENRPFCRTVVALDKENV